MVVRNRFFILHLDDIGVSLCQQETKHTLFLSREELKGLWSILGPLYEDEIQKKVFNP